MKRRATKTWTVAAFAALFAACSSTGAIDPSVDTPGGFARAYCGLIAPCCAEAEIHPRKVSCDALLTGEGNRNAFDRDGALKCIAAMKAASARDDFCAGLGGYAVRRACDHVTELDPPGRAQPGESCASPNDCALPRDAVEIDCHAVDAAGTVGGVGGTDGGVASSGTCVAEVTGAVGDAPCIGDLGVRSASYSWFGFQGQAAPARVYLCDEALGARCERATKTCVAFGAPGQPCGSTVAACSAGARCDKMSFTCAAAGRLGAPCATSDDCDSTTYCGATKVCATKLGTGACKSDGDCRSGTCQGACRAPIVELGAAPVCGA